MERSVPDFRTWLHDDRVHFFDGAYGTFLQARGLPAGYSPEIFGFENPDVVASVHQDYRDGGAEILTTNTFGGTAPKLEGKADVKELNRLMAQTARKVAGDEACIGGSVGPTGLFIEPLGPVSFLEMIAIFREQIEGLVEGGIDLIKIETLFDLAEARAAVIAAREVTDLPILASMTYEGATSLTGSAPQVFVDVMQNMGVDIIGVNCSAGPDEIMKTVQAMLPRLETPFHVQPNAGLPELDENGCTVFRLGPDEFAKKCLMFIEAGAKIMGGCCGTGPDHIRALKSAAQGSTWHKPAPAEKPAVVVASRSRSVCFGVDRPAVVIGERINPTGKKQLIEELQNGTYDYALQLAEEQVANGAHVLDVNVGAPMVDETEALPTLVRLLAERRQTPLCIDSSDPAAVEAALPLCPGSALVNSISGEPGRMEQLGPLCKKYGAPFILLPLKGKKLPVTAAERIAIIKELVAQAESLGIPRRLIIVDALVLAVSSKPESGKACFETIRWCAEQGLPTTMGLSNISFGLPARELINSAFLSMSMQAGLSSFIVNPSSTRLRQAMHAAEVLLGRDDQAETFIAHYAEWKPGQESGGAAPGARKAKKIENLRQAVVAGAKDDIVKMIDAALEKEANPFAMVNEEMIPGIMEVGDKYERKEYFLPQLMLSAETMQKGFERLKPLLVSDSDEERPTVVFATVEGDIHDIGKNIVCLMLRNHGFEVVDLGKDVPASAVVDAAREHGASVIGLSALMTTTMVRMEEVVSLVRENSLPAKVMVGGAVVTQQFADSIGADGYSEDAVGAVRMAKKLAGEQTASAS
jgi:5-methyltetrahydrofolate--homocysteine methyltransferase